MPGPLSATVIAVSSTVTATSGAMPASSQASRALSSSSFKTTSGHCAGRCPVCATSSFSLQKSSRRDVRNVSRCRPGSRLVMVAAAMPPPRASPGPTRPAPPRRGQAFGADISERLRAVGGLLYMALHDTFFEAPVPAGAFLFRELVLLARSAPTASNGVSWSGPHRGFTLGENVFEPLAGNAPGMGRAEAIAPTARAAPNLHALLRDTEQLRDLTGGIVVEFHYALSISVGERREPS